ncbi:MAG: primosomal protein, partial [Pseudomonadota bacterium]
MIHWYSIVVQTPAHSPLAGLLTYQSDQVFPVGSLVRVPLGSRELLGVVWQQLDVQPEPMFGAQGKEIELKAITADLGIQAVSPAWLKLVSFTANYYQRSLGEVALAALPPQLRTLDALQVERRLKRIKATETPAEKPVEVSEKNQLAINNVALNAEQTSATAQISIEFGPFLLFGATGSGKTEVYLRAALEALQCDPTAQVLMMVPEINLT